MFTERQKSIADAPTFSRDNRFTGSPHHFPAYMVQLRTQAQTKSHGFEMLSPSFQKPTVSKELDDEIEALDRSTREFENPQGGNQHDRTQAVAMNQSNLQRLQILISKKLQILRQLEKMTQTAAELIQHLRNTTGGRVSHIIDMVTAATSADSVMAPSQIAMTIRTQCYIGGSSIHTANEIKRETENLRTANTPYAIRDNTEFLSTAIINMESINIEHNSYWNPVLARAATDLATLRREAQELQQPPANQPPGQLFQIDQAALAAKQEEINNKLVQQETYTRQSQFDAIQPLKDRDLGRSLLGSIPSTTNDGNVVELRNNINNLVFDSTTIHPFSTYTHMVLTVISRQEQTRQISSAPQITQNPHLGYGAWEEQVPIKEEHAMAAYARPPDHTRGGTPLHMQICHAYRSPQGCRDGQYCPRIHQQAAQTNHHGAARRQNINQHQGNNQGGQGHYQSNNQSGQGYYHNQDNNQGGQDHYQGNNGGGYNGGGYNGGGYNGDQQRGRSRSPGGRPLDNGQRQRQRTGSSREREQGPPQNPPPQNPPPPGRGRSQSPNRGQYPGRGGSPYRSRDSSQG